MTRRGIKSAHVIVFLHTKPESNERNDFKLRTNFYKQFSESFLSSFLFIAAIMSGIQMIRTNIEQDGDALRLEFNNFLCNVIAGVSEKREKEELNIIG